MVLPLATCMPVKSPSFLGFALSYVKIEKVIILAPISSRIVGRLNVIINYYQLFYSFTLPNYFPLIKIKGHVHMGFLISRALLIRDACGCGDHICFREASS